MDTAWLQALANYGALGGISLWLMLRMEKKLETLSASLAEFTKSMDRLSDAIRDMEK
jgi:hypothetical protein